MAKILQFLMSFPEYFISAISGKNLENPTCYFLPIFKYGRKVNQWKGSFV